MAQINLLKQPTSKTTLALPKVFVWVALFVFVGSVVYYAYLSVLIKKAKAETADFQLKIDSDKQEVLTIPQKDEIFTRQLQLKTLSGLIAKHIYWSQLFPKLASVTFNTATYSALRIGSDNSIVLSGIVPSIEDFDLYLQVFDQPDVYKYFNHVKISSFVKVQNKNTTSIKFEATIQYDPAIVQYLDPNKKASK